MRKLAWMSALLFVVSCDSGSQEPAELVVDDEEGTVFFDQDRLLEGAIDLSDEAAQVDCVGATEEEKALPFHPRRLMGQVLAPDGRMAKFDERWWQRLIPTAHAAPLEGELPVAEIAVRLTNVDERGEPVDDGLRETTTNIFGQWCIHLPEDVEFGPTLMVIAESDEYRLRRPVLHQNDVDIYSQPEALVQLVIEEGLLLTRLDVDTYLNLDVMAQTAVDLLQPVTVRSGAGLDSLLARLDTTMRDDPRLMAAVERVHRAGDEE